MTNNKPYDTIALPSTTAEWLALRTKGIGGSDVAAILGISKWSTAMDVWRRKTGREGEQADNETLYWGRCLEAPILERFSRETGIKVAKPDSMFVSKEHPFMVANLDGLTEDGEVVEIKTARFGADWGTEIDAVPNYYLTQVQHYMAVTGAPVAHIAVLIGGFDFRRYRIEANKPLQDFLIEKEAQFWDLVQKDEMPEVQSIEDANRKWASVIDKSSIEGTPEDFATYSQLININQQIKALESQGEALKLKLMCSLQNNNTLTYNGERLCSWGKPSVRRTVDSKRLKAEAPDLFEKFSKEIILDRTFRLNTKGI